MSFGRAERVFIVAHAAEPPSSDEWDAYVNALEADLPELRGVLVFSVGGSLNAKQREQTAQLTKRGSLRVAMLTDSKVVRGAVTAMSWLEVPIEAFDSNEEERALDHLRVAGDARATVVAALRELQAQLPPAVKLRSVRPRQRSGSRPATADATSGITKPQRAR